MSTRAALPRDSTSRTAALVATPPPARSAADIAPAFYAARAGGWRDYWTLLHPPYTVWHLSYVLLGAALAPAPDPRIVVGALAAFGLAVGVASHAFDELSGRPLRTAIPAWVLIALGSVSLAAAVCLGLVATTVIGPGFGLYVAAGAAIVLLYGLDAPIVHSDLGFAVGWGAFPVAATACAAGAYPVPAVMGAIAAALLSLAQRRLSTRARQIRRRSVSISGEVVYADGQLEAVDTRALIGAPEAALSILWLALPIAAGAMLLTRWL